MGPARCYWRLASAGFRRYSTYRQAMVAGLATNVVFGMMRVSVLLAVFATREQVVGYDPARMATFVWLGQGLLAVVLLWGGQEIADRVRSGDIVIDLIRPWHIQTAALADDLGRAGYALLTRFLPPIVFGAALFPFYWPQWTVTWLVFAVSVALAVITSFAMRFLLSLIAFWWLDVRGVVGLYGVVSGIMSGLTLPLAFFPDWAQTLLWFTPFPALLQTPIDVFVERGPTAALLAHQLAWTVLAVAAGRVVLARAERRLVVQGG